MERKLAAPFSLLLAMLQELIHDSFATFFLPEDEWEHDGSQTRSWENRTLPTDQTQAGVEFAKRIWTSMFDTNLWHGQLKKADESNINLEVLELAAIGKANLVFVWSIWLSWQTGWVQTRGFPCPRQVSPHHRIAESKAVSDHLRHFRINLFCRACSHDADISLVK